MARLLLVDDDDVLRRILVLLLNRAGHSVAEAGTGPEALDWVAREAFDAILVDVMMPGMDGYELVRRLRAARGRASAILLMTASLQGPDPELARAAGADAYVMKTTNPGRLSAQLEALLAGPAGGEA